jgi:hypothetical protein
LFENQNFFVYLQCNLKKEGEYMVERLKTTKEVLAMLGISYTTLWRIRKKLAMFTTEKKLKNYYSQEDIKEIELQLKKENACRI